MPFISEPCTTLPFVIGVVIYCSVHSQCIFSCVPTWEQKTSKATISRNIEYFGQLLQSGANQRICMGYTLYYETMRTKQLKTKGLYQNKRVEELSKKTCQAFAFIPVHTTRLFFVSGEYMRLVISTDGAVISRCIRLELFIRVFITDEILQFFHRMGIIDLFSIHIIAKI